MNFFEKEKLSAVKAKEQAQWITFAPFVFQATRVLRNSGILSTIEAHREGISLEDLTAAVKLPAYGVRVLRGLIFARASTLMSGAGANIMSEPSTTFASAELSSRF